MQIDEPGGHDLPLQFYDLSRRDVEVFCDSPDLPVDDVDIGFLVPPGEGIDQPAVLKEILHWCEAPS